MKAKKERRQLDPLHVRYRPQKLRDVIGQPSTVSALEKLLSGRRIPHSYLFTGPSGVGKTTLARIIGGEDGMQISPENIHEVDAATNSGIEEMKEIKRHVELPAFGPNPQRLLILDEVHALTAKVWSSWLKIIEEPPPHLFIVFCTTEASRVPKTIKTRCHTFNLKAVPTKDIMELLVDVISAEEETLYGGSLRMIASKAEGSVRQALVYLSMCIGAESKADVMAILEEADELGPVQMQICRAIINHQNFWKVLKLIDDLEDDNVESVRFLILNYAGKVLLGLNKGTSKKAGWMFEIMEEMSEPFDPSLRKAPLILAAGRLLF